MKLKVDDALGVSRLVCKDPVYVALSKPFLRVQKNANLEVAAIAAAVKPKTEAQSLTAGLDKV